MAAAADWPIASCIIGFGAFWYGAEVLLTLALGWHFSSRSLLTMPLRDLLLPALWVAAWAGNGFVWRGNSMRVSDRPRAA
jgi:ceramide glucosyltransferase